MSNQAHPTTSPDPSASASRDLTDDLSQRGLDAAAPIHPTEDSRAGGEPAPLSAGALILVGVDGSEDGLRAARYAARTALASDTATVHLVNAVDDAVMAGAWGVVYDPSVLQQAGERAVQAATEAVREVGLDSSRISTEVVLGNAAAVLGRMSEKASLMVMGRRSVSGLERMFVGSTSVATVAAAHCPTVVISAAASPAPTGRKGLVVAGIDAGGVGPRTLAWAFDEAEARGARLEVVHVAVPQSARIFGRGGSSEQAKQAQIEAARQAVTQLVEAEAARHPGVDCTVEVLYGNAVDALAARTGHADLLVLGNRHPAPGRAVGGVIRGLMAHSQSPLCLVP